MLHSLEVLKTRDSFNNIFIGFMTTSKNGIFVGVIFHTLVYRLFPYSCIFFFFREDREITTINILVQ